MNASTVKKGVAALCFLFGVALFLVGGYYLWSAPIEHGWWGVVAIVAGLLLHVFFWAMWS
jgi:hypothetical protein